MQPPDIIAEESQDLSVWPDLSLLSVSMTSINDSSYANLSSVSLRTVLDPINDIDSLKCLLDPQHWLVRSVLDNGWQVLFRMRLLFYLVWPSEIMFPSLEQVPRFVAEMFPVFFIVAVLENAIRLLQGRKALRVNESIGSLSAGIFQECFRIKVRSIEVLMYCLVWQNFRLVTLEWNSLWTWWICYFGVDLGFYWAHRLAHEVNFIWAVHQAHHSSEEFSTISALRQAVLQPFTAWFTYVPLALFVPPQVFLAHMQLSELYMVWLHTEVIDTIGPLEYILNTPSHHRVHHSRNPEYIDKNYGGMLIIWDRLFGTFKSEDKNNPPVYGIVHPVASFNPIYVQFHTWPIIWKRLSLAKSIAERLGIIFNGPGWLPGLARLGDPSKLPPIVRPVAEYDPKVHFWKNAYAVIHFALILFFYHELTLYQDKFSPLVLNVGVLSLLVSITTIGLMLDNRRRFNSVYELTRCLLFFQARRPITRVLDHGLKRAGLNIQLRMLVIASIILVFLLSMLINLVSSILTLLSSNRNYLANLIPENKRFKKTQKLL